MSVTTADVASGHHSDKSTRMAAAAWVLAAVYYFYQYMLRSAPSVMMQQLSATLGLSAIGVASMLGLFYYGYSPFSLVAGAAMDRLGPRRVLPTAAAVVGVGALLFATGRTDAAILHHLSRGAAEIEHQHYQLAFAPLLLGVAVAIALTLFLKETGPGVGTPFSGIEQEV